MSFLILSASVLVVGGLLWVLQRLIANAADDASIQSRQLLVAAVLVAAASMLMIYLTR